MESDAKKNLYKPEDYRECLDRMGRLSADSQPVWGTMTVGQMLAHCAEVQEVANGKRLQKTPLIVRLFKGTIRKMVLSDKPYKKSLQTHPQYRQPEDRDFDAEKQRLLAALASFSGDDSRGTPHPLFGPLTRDEKGWSCWKHLDHHLRQFGV